MKTCMHKTFASEEILLQNKPNGNLTLD